MPVILFYVGTLILFVAGNITWHLAELSFAECFNGGPAIPFWLLLCGGLTVGACLFFVAFICNVIDILRILWRETPKAVRHDR